MLPPGLDFALYAVGGMTFPIMAFLLTEGYAHTSDVRKYAVRLGVFALIAQVPYSLLFGVQANVLFTLLVGLGILCLGDRFGTAWGAVATIVATLLLAAFADWGSIGLVAIFLFGTLREARRAPSPPFASSKTLLPNQESLPSQAPPSGQAPPPSQAPFPSQTSISGQVPSSSHVPPSNQAPFQPHALSQPLMSSENVSRETFEPQSRTLAAPSAHANSAPRAWVTGKTEQTGQATPIGNVSRETFKKDQVSPARGIPMPLASRTHIPSKPEQSERAESDPNVSRETIPGRRADVFTIVGTMLVLLCVTCLSALSAGDAFALGYALVGFTAATVLLCLYRGRRGHSMKWLFYAYYPLHLFAIWLIAVILM